MAAKCYVSSWNLLINTDTAAYDGRVLVTQVSRFVPHYSTCDFNDTMNAVLWLTVSFLRYSILLVFTWYCALLYDIGQCCTV